METVKPHFFSFLKMCTCIVLLAFSSTVFAEYYVVYAAPATVGCGVCAQKRVYHKPCFKAKKIKRYYKPCGVKYKRVYYHRAARSSWSPCPVDGAWVTNSCTGCDAIPEASWGCGRRTITYYDDEISFDRRTADDVTADIGWME